VRALDFNNKLNENQIDTIAENLTFIVRKGAHFSIYAVLCIFLALLVKEYGIFGKWRFILSVLVCFLYACSDEFHQIFVSDLV
jgi:VanZ family protein